MCTVLIVEDEENNMKLATDLLNMHGYTVLQAWNGEDGVRVAKEKKPNLILMDIDMPIMDGLTATRILKLDINTSHIKIVIVTAKAMRGDEAKILANGADLYLAKPYRYQELLTIVEKCCEEHVLGKG